jgi:hypothetical protein
MFMWLMTMTSNDFIFIKFMKSGLKVLVGCVEEGLR